MTRKAKVVAIVGSYRKGGMIDQVLVASSAAPAFMARLLTPIVKVLRRAAELPGGRTVGVLLVGLAALEKRQGPRPRTLARARLLGKKLVS